MKREKFGSRLGFILISAGCAIGLGNVWRFPYVTGQYGGAAFVIIYLLFLVILGLPIMVMELAVGRASQKSIAMAFDTLEPKGTKWHNFKYAAMAGNYLLMMFYTTIGGWMLIYACKMLSGRFTNMGSKAISAEFSDLMGQPGLMTGAMIFVIVISLLICSMGLQNGVEKITKTMMILLFVLLIILAVRACSLPGASEGLKFYLLPDFGKVKEAGLATVIFAAMSQAFFTLSVGMGSIAIFGSYIGKERSLTGEAVCITALDTIIALLAGLIIFPACFAFHVNPDSGPGLIFVTMPNIFQSMGGGRLWGSFFFICMLFASISTIIAVFENIISFAIDMFGASRRKAVTINVIAIILLSLPCVLGFNLWSGFQPMGAGTTIMDLEDFLVSSNILPLGGLVFLIFCTRKSGWGWKSFLKESNTGAGLPFPKQTRFYVAYILPLIVLFIFIQGYVALFGA